MTTVTGHTKAIPASRVKGTSVYSTSGDKIGSVEDVMLDKTTNNIMFAVVSFGGFLGIGEKYHAIPWSSLDYEKKQDGYVVPYSEDQLKAAPVHDLDDLTKNDGYAARDAAYDYYKAPRY